jgi:hypothetical protein
MFPEQSDCEEFEDMSWQASVNAAVSALRKAESDLEKQLEQVRGKIASLQGLGKGAAGKRGGKRRLSAAGREAIARAARRRWAEYRKQQKK